MKFPTCLKSPSAWRRRSAWRAISLATLAALGALAFAFLCDAASAADEKKPTTAVKRASRDKSNYRQLAPGIEVTIPPDRQEEETVSRHNVVEILQGVPNLDWTPKFSSETATLREMATNTVFRRKIWYLEFTFKPVRMIYIDEPQPSGKMQRKLIWYLVYHVRNTGGHLGFEKQPAGVYSSVEENYAARFIPQFVLEATEYKKAYLDRLIPVAIEPIQQREDPNRKLLNSIEISGRPIPVSTDQEDNSVWGVATWEDLDPRIDFFSISIQGLTNAYKWSDPAGAFKAGDAPGEGRMLTQKTLVLNFWRPGDEFVEGERNIHFGIPGKVDYAWIYR